MERKGVYVGEKKGVSVITERISSNSILKITTFKRSTTEGCVYICSVGPFSNANSTPRHVFLCACTRGNSCIQSAVLFSKAGQVRVCATANPWVSDDGPIGAICGEPKAGDQTQIYRLLSELISPQTSSAQ